MWHCVGWWNAWCFQLFQHSSECNLPHLIAAYISYHCINRKCAPLIMLKECFGIHWSFTLLLCVSLCTTYGWPLFMLFRIFKEKLIKMMFIKLLNNKDKDNTNLYIILESTTIFQEWNVFFLHKRNVNRIQRITSLWIYYTCKFYMHKFCTMCAFPTVKLSSNST